MNSVVRGTVGCIMSQVCIPIQNRIGDGGLYTLVAGLLAVGCSGITLTMCEWIPRLHLGLSPIGDENDSLELMGLLVKGTSWRDPEHRFSWPWASRDVEHPVPHIAPVVTTAEGPSGDGRSETSVVAPVS